MAINIKTFFVLIVFTELCCTQLGWTKLTSAQTIPTKFGTTIPAIDQNAIPRHPIMIGHSMVLQEPNPQDAQDLRDVPSPPSSANSNIPAQPGLEVASNAENIDEASFRRSKRRCRRCGCLCRLRERRRQNMLARCRSPGSKCQANWNERSMACSCLARSDKRQQPD
jgi:hypothetical protein